MNETPFPYSDWVEQALQGVVRSALQEVAEKGLCGDHHFFITYQTDAEGVEIPGFLRAQYPEEITIVIQHQFWDLNVNEDFFEITLSFNGKNEYLRVPFRTITAFADPGINFGLQIKTNQEEPEEKGSPSLTETAAAPALAPQPVTALKPQRLTEDVAADDEPAIDPADEDADASDDEEKSGEVIALDAFRKK